MTAYDDVLKELLDLRRSRSNTAIDFKESPHLAWHLGRGNIDVVQRFLAALSRIEDDEVQAALASLGFFSHASNVEDRMSDFAVERGIEATRTVRRWADEGFKKIAHLVIEWSEEEANDSALVKILLHHQPHHGLQVHLLGTGGPSIKMLLPTVKVNFEQVDLVLDDLPDNTEAEQLFFSSSFAVPIPRDEGLRPRVEVEWLGNTQTRYAVQVHPSIREYVTTSIVTKKGCEIYFDDSARFSIS